MVRDDWPRYREHFPASGPGGSLWDLLCNELPLRTWMLHLSALANHLRQRAFFPPLLLT
jgi:hypothetical protein